MSGLVFAPDADDSAICALLADVITSSAPVRLALAGGATPAPILRRLIGLGLDMAHVQIWPTDERCVAPDHPAANIAALRAIFADTGARIHPLIEGPAPGPFDLVWLGMGADGHIASLFPRPDIAIAAPAAIVCVTPEPLPPEAPFARLTLNYAALLDAERIIIVARGAVKRPLLEAAARGEGDLPVTRMVRAARAPVVAYWAP